MKKLKLFITILSISIYLNISSAEDVVDHDVDYLEVAALGRYAAIGQLYDARTDKFIPMKLFKDSKKLAAKIDRIDNTDVQMSFMNNTLEEKLTYLEIQDQIILSVLSNNFLVSGSAKFLFDEKHSSSNAKASLGVSITTVNEEVSFEHVDVRKLIDLDVLKQVDATHVVIGIHWGGRIVISVEQDGRENVGDNVNVDENLHDRLQSLVTLVSAKNSARIEEQLKNETSDLMLKIYKDIDLEAPVMNLVDALKLIIKSTELVKEHNYGKGRQMSYNIFPLHLLRTELFVKPSVSHTLKSIDVHTIESGVKWLKYMHGVEKKVSEMLDEQSKYKDYIAKKKLDELEELSEKFDKYQSEMKASIAKCVVNIRSGIETDDRLLDLIGKAHIGLPLPFWYIEYELNFVFLKSLFDLNVNVLDKYTSVNAFLNEHDENDIYAFFFSDDYIESSEGAWIAFKRILGERERDAIFVAIKIDVVSKTERKNYFQFNGLARLRLYKNRDCRSDCIIDNVS